MAPSSLNRRAQGSVANFGRRRVKPSLSVKYAEGVKLLHRRVGDVPHGYHLSLANGMHDFNPCNRTARGPEGVESQHGANDPFHRSVVLLYDSIRILRVTDNDRGLVCFVVACDRCRVAAALVNRDLFGESLGANSLAEKSLGRRVILLRPQQKIHIENPLEQDPENSQGCDHLNP
jgi:hypothetical protein